MSGDDRYDKYEQIQCAIFSEYFWRSIPFNFKANLDHIESTKYYINEEAK